MWDSERVPRDLSVKNSCVRKMYVMCSSIAQFKYGNDDDDDVMIDANKCDD